MAAFVLVQPQPRASLARTRMLADGHQAIALAFHQLVPLDPAIAQLATMNLTGFDRIVFSSPSSVAFAADALAGRLNNASVAAIGQGSATVLIESGLVASDKKIIRPRTPPFDSAALAALEEMSSQHVRSLLVVKGSEGRNDWIERYRAAGTQVQCAQIYRSESITPTDTAVDQLNALMSAGHQPVLVVGSISEFNGLTQWLGNDSRNALCQWMQTLTTVVPHGRIAAVLSDASWQTLHTTRAGQTLHQAALELA